MTSNSYDDIPYESHTVAQTHPQHLFTLGTLFGLKPTLPDKAKVLELGCANGANLIPMAYHLPHAHFIGIDASRSQIADGLAQIKALGLNNITLIHQAIADFNSPTPLDYILCHGVFSWVNDTTQQQILQLCAKHLAPHGIAYMSYNTYPGWKIASIVRDMMLWHTGQITAPIDKANEARYMLEWLYPKFQNMKTHYSEIICQEMNILSEHSDSQLIHEHLSMINTPYYFYEFMRLVNDHRLTFLSEAFLSNMPKFTSQPISLLELIEHSQYHDFMHNQRFRCTLLCHQERSLEYAVKDNAIENYYLQLNPTHSHSDLKADPILALAYAILHEEKFKPIHYQELYQKLEQRSAIINLKDSIAALNQQLLRDVFLGEILISYFPGNYSIEKSLSPCACPLARMQLTLQDFVVNRRHENIRLTPTAEVILPYLDGTHSLNALIDIVRSKIDEGVLVLVDKHQQTIHEEKAMRDHIKKMVIETIELLAQRALLI